MHFPRLIAPALLTALLTVPAIASAQSDGAPGFNPAGLPHKAGTYRCELNRIVDVRHVAEDLRTAIVHWNKRDYSMTAVNTHSGALRYEDAGSGLVWLVIVGKSMLLDTKVGKQLANECRA